MMKNVIIVKVPPNGGSFLRWDGGGYGRVLNFVKRQVLREVRFT